MSVLPMFLFACVSAALGGDALTNHATLADPGEPGEPMMIEATLYEHDGVTPIPNATVFVYHACLDGEYHRDAHNIARIHGTVRTDKAGHFSFSTVRPGAYPGGGVAVHVHVEIEAPGKEKRFSEIHFSDDPQIRPASKELAEKQGKFRMIIALTKDKGRWQGVWNYKY